MGALRGRAREPFLTLHHLRTLPKGKSRLQWRSTGGVSFVLGTEAGRLQLKGWAPGGLQGAEQQGQGAEGHPPSIFLPSLDL